MFVSKRGFAVVLSLALAVGCTAAEVSEDSSNVGPGNGANDSPTANGGAGQEGASAPSTSSSSSGGSSSGGSSSGGSSSGGSSSGGSSSGSPAPAVSWACTKCSAFAANEANGGPLQFWSMCAGQYDFYKGAAPKSAQLYEDYLGCLCSGPCATDCETSLCALQASTATPACKTCLANTNAACSSTKSACLADQ